MQTLHKKNNRRIPLDKSFKVSRTDILLKTKGLLSLKTFAGDEEKIISCLLAINLTEHIYFLEGIKAYKEFNKNKESIKSAYNVITKYTDKYLIPILRSGILYEKEENISYNEELLPKALAFRKILGEIIPFFDKCSKENPLPDSLKRKNDFYVKNTKYSERSRIAIVLSNLTGYFFSKGITDSWNIVQKSTTLINAIIPEESRFEETRISKIMRDFKIRKYAESNIKSSKKKLK